MTRENIEKRVDLTELKQLDELLARGKGLLCVPAHHGNWELCGYAVALKGYPLQSVARPLDNPSLNELVTMRQFAAARENYPPVRIDSLPHVNRVYATMAHEVLGWLRRAGARAPVRLVEAMDSGESFGEAYMRLGGGEPDR